MYMGYCQSNNLSGQSNNPYEMLHASDIPAAAHTSPEDPSVSGRSVPNMSKAEPPATIHPGEQPPLEYLEDNQVHIYNGRPQEQGYSIHSAWLSSSNNDARILSVENPDMFSNYAHHSRHQLSSYNPYRWNTSNQVDPSLPRSYSGLDIIDSSNNYSGAYPPSAYQIHCSKQSVPPETKPQLSRHLTYFENDYDSQASSPYGDDIVHPDHMCSPSYQQISILSPSPNDLYPHHHPTGEEIINDECCKDDRSEEETPDDAQNDREQPYAQLIYRALLNAPNNTMVLRDIYTWFREHTDKAQEKDSKGWQNSIRHNLSMNGVCS
jgi:hypothetical protein